MVELRRVALAVLRYTPLSVGSFLLGAVGLAVALLLWRPLVRATGWGSPGTLAALVLGVGVLALTLTPGRAVGPRGVRSCVRAAQVQVDSKIGQIATSPEALLNLVLLAPLGFALVLATRRAWLAALLVLALPGVVELAQTRVPGRVCSGLDYLTNATGGLAGVALGALALALGGAARRVRAR